MINALALTALLLSVMALCVNLGVALSTHRVYRIIQDQEKEQ